MSTSSRLTPEQADGLRIAIEIAAACWREENPSYSWHVMQYQFWKVRCTIPMVIHRPIITYASA